MKRKGDVDDGEKCAGDAEDRVAGLSTSAQSRGKISIHSESEA